MIPSIDQLTLEEKLAQLVFVRIGSNLPPIATASEHEERVARLIDECPVGGLVLFNGQWPQVAQTLERLQSKCRVPMLVGADLERGAGQQIAGLTMFPHARTFAQLGDVADAMVREAARITAREARDAGVNVLFGPVADSNTNPQNPIIATRAFGEDPAEIAKLVAAAVEATQAVGSAATAKHFPGHGDTSRDSHAELPSVDRSIEDLQRIELPPFRAAINAGVDLVMTAHVSYPAFDPSGAPATFSRPILEGLLREELGFDGIVCSDSLLMAGACGQFESEGEMAAAAIEAGLDVLLDVANPKEVVTYLQKQVEAGRITIERIDRSVRRILDLKTRVTPPVDVRRAATSIDKLADSRSIAATISKGAIVQIGAAPLRFDETESWTAVLLKPFELPTDPPQQPLSAAARSLLTNAEYFEFGPEVNATLVAEAIQSAAETDRVLLAIIAKPAAWHAFGMTNSQKSLASRLAEQPGTVVASLGVPTILKDFPDSVPKICTYSDIPASQAALVEFLFTAEG